MTTLSVELGRLGDQKRLCSIKTERGGGGGGRSTARCRVIQLVN